MRANATALQVKDKGFRGDWVHPETRLFLQSAAHC